MKSGNSSSEFVAGIRKPVFTEPFHTGYENKAFNEKHDKMMYCFGAEKEQERTNQAFVHVFFDKDND
jgi:hypothetical protein